MRPGFERGPDALGRGADDHAAAGASWARGPVIRRPRCESAMSQLVNRRLPPRPDRDHQRQGQREERRWLPPQPASSAAAAKNAGQKNPTSGARANMRRAGRRDQPTLCRARDGARRRTAPGDVARASGDVRHADRDERGHDREASAMSPQPLSQPAWPLRPASNTAPHRDEGEDAALLLHGHRAADQPRQRRTPSRTRRMRTQRDRGRGARRTPPGGMSTYPRRMLRRQLGQEGHEKRRRQASLSAASTASGPPRRSRRAWTHRGTEGSSCEAVVAGGAPTELREPPRERDVGG